MMQIKASTETKRSGIEIAVHAGALKEGVGARNSRVFTWVGDLPEDKL
jgi:hypothetical protein